jgi:hypothetical protein
MVHVMLVSHVRCAEHGEMVDVDRDVDHQSAAPVSTGPTLRATALLAKEHPHDHCTAITDRRQLCSHTVAQLLDAPPSVKSRPCVVIATIVPTRSLYRLAPKISPPITA